MTTCTPMEQFEIDDPQLPASGLLVKFANNFNTRILRPVTRIIDPIYEGYKYFQMQYERSILKLGNPLVVKRLLYVSFVMVIVLVLQNIATTILSVGPVWERSLGAGSMISTKLASL